MKDFPLTIAKSLLVLIIVASSAQAQTESRVEKNVVYGMVSGAALLMDVYYPAEPNGRGVLYLQGSGFHGPTHYSARQLKENRFIRERTQNLLDIGFTVFVANYRLAPVFRYPAHIQDVRRAVRYLRANASDFGIAPEPLGAYGTSAGAVLSGLLALQDGLGDMNSDDPVERLSAKVQAAVVSCAVLDFTIGPAGDHLAVWGSYLGEPKGGQRGSPVSPVWIEASPLTYLSDDDPPLLIAHALDDDTAPYETAEMGVQTLRDAGLDVEFMPRETGGHCRGDVPHERIAEWLEEKLVNWCNALTVRNWPKSDFRLANFSGKLTSESGRSRGMVVRFEFDPYLTVIDSENSPLSR